MKTKAFDLKQKEINSLRTAEKRFGDGHTLAAVRDLFALGLYLRMTGHKEEGYTACSTALRALQLGEALSKTILAHLDGSELTLARRFWAHSDIKRLIENHATELLP